MKCEVGNRRDEIGKIKSILKAEQEGSLLVWDGCDADGGAMKGEDFAGEAESDTGAVWLCGVKRDEDFRKGRGNNARAIVCDL